MSIGELQRLALMERPFPAGVAVESDADALKIVAPGKNGFFVKFRGFSCC